MKGTLSIWFTKLTKKGVSRVDKDLFIFAFFLFLSFIFWYLNSLGKEIESDIKYPIRYINLPTERVLTEDLPSKLELYLKGPGYAILKLKLSGNRAPVVLDFSTVNYRRVQGSKTPVYYIKTSGLITRLANQLRAGCEITAIKPDTLFFTFDRVISKNIPVYPAVKVETERQYSVTDKIMSEPDSVIITGPKRILDTILVARTKYMKYSGLNKTVKKKIALITSDDYVLSNRKVSLTIPVGQFTEAETMVNVKILNLPDSIGIKIFPDAVTVRGLVSVSDYKMFEEIPFDAVIDLSGVDLQSDEKLPVELRNIPPFVNSLRISPAKVDFLIEKKKK